VSTKTGEDHNLPNNIETIIPVAVSDFPEYIWTNNDSYWLTDNIPRICTVGELGKLSDPTVLKSIMKKPFVSFVR